jgi:hypothetical protein
MVQAHHWTLLIAEFILLPRAFPAGVSVGDPSVAVATVATVVEVCPRDLEVCRVVGAVVVNEVGWTAQSEVGHDLVGEGGVSRMTVVTSS